MDNPLTSWRTWVTGKPFAVWVVFGGLFYFGIGLLVLVLPFFLAAPGDPIGISSIVFAAILLLAAFLSLKGKRWTFVLAVVVTVLFLLLFGPFIAPSLLNPAEPSFWLAISGVPALLLSLIFSILALQTGKAGVATKPYLASARSDGGLFTLAVVGFVIGGLVVGNIAAASIARILDGANRPSNIVIVPNAAIVDVPFSPRTFNVAVGGTVVWYNGDTATHTASSNTTGQFESGNLLPGARFQHTFNTAGTYTYHCTPHPWMTGTIVVT